MKRLLSLLLAAAMIFALLPMAAFAEDEYYFATNKIKATYSLSGNVGTCESNGTTLTASATGYKVLSIFSQSSTMTVTITNVSGLRGKIAFDYVPTIPNGGAISVAGTAVTSSGHYESSELDTNGSIKISVKSPSGQGTSKIVLSNFRLDINASFSVTFLKPENGTATAGGYDLSAMEGSSYTVNDVSYNEGIAVTATPASGYKFYKWLDENNNIVCETANGTIQPTGNITVRPLFYSNTTALFGVGKQIFNDLKEAVSAAQTGSTKTIVLLQDGILPSGDYSIPNGITLLIPMDSTNTCYTTEPEVVYGSHKTPSAFRTLTMASGANITVASGGAISVPSKLSATGTNNGSWNGTPTDKHGRITMNAGSTIDVQSGGKLYVYGYISGQGNVYARSGSEVWECFQIRCWRGGTATSGMAGNSQKVFPLNQYYVQNIEAPITYYPNAKEMVYTAVNMSSKAFGASATFVGSGGMFSISTGSATKRFTGASDRLELSVDGDFSITQMSLSIENLPGVGTLELNTADYVLPINSNITIKVNYGTTTINQDVAFLPGTEMTIANGAEVEIASGHKAYVYDKDQWGAYAASGQQLVVVGYSTVNGTTAKRTADSLVDSKIDVNGTLTVAGQLYTTESGAAIISSAGTGKYIQQAAPGNVTNTYQATQTSSDITYVSIPITAAKLQNLDGSFTNTSEVSSGTTIPYVGGYWGERPHVLTIHRNDGTDESISFENITSIEAAILFLIVDPDAEPCWAREGFTLIGWSEDPNGVNAPVYTAEDTIIVDHDMDLYAIWAKIEYVAQFDPNGGDGTIENMYGYLDDNYEITLPDQGDIYRDGYSFVGWCENADGIGTVYYANDTVTLTGDTTFYAQWEPEIYLITWVVGDQTTTTQVAYGQSPVYEGATPAKTPDENNHYTFAGWNDGNTTYEGELPAATESVTYTAVFTGEAHTYGAPVWTWENDYSSAAAAFTCSVCSHEHSENATVTSETTDATCMTDGSTVYTATVTFNGQTYTDSKTVTIPATSHAWGEPTYVWSNDNSTVTATRVCANDASHVETETVETTSVTTAATCEIAGSTVYTATFTNAAFATQTKEITIPAVGHAWGEPVWNWTGYTAATATFTCTNDSTHVQTVNATITSETTAATCEADGQTVYTAEITFYDQQFTDTKEVTLPAIGHNWIDPVWSWADDFSTASVTLTCGNNTEHTTTVEATITNEITIQPTCTDPGVMTYTATATAGGKTFTDIKTKTLPTTNHTWGTPAWNWTGYTAATATFTCTECDETHSETTTNITSEITTQPTCEGTGVKTYTATVTFNGQTYTDTEEEVLPATGHSWGEPAWTWNGYTAATATFTCTNDPLHTMTLDAAITSSIVEPTCTEPGKTIYTAKVHLGDTEYSDIKEVTTPALGHDWGEWTVTTAPTCTEAGVETRTCLRCGETETRPVEALGHDLTHHDAVDATCTTAGSSEYWSCSRCGKYFSDAACTNEIQENSWVIPALGHNWGEWTVTTAPTCTEAGVETRTCLRCGETETRPVEALGHDLTHHDAVDATCTTAGSSEYWSCSRCGKYFSDAACTNEIQENSWVIPALGHNWGEWTVTTAPTCTEAGVETRTCSRCGETETRPVEALGHDLTHHDAVEATCTTAGSSEYWSCSRCGKYFSNAACTNEIQENSWVIPALGHTWGAPSWTWTGYTAATATFTCEHDSTHVQTVNATITSATTPATPTQPGSVVYTATVEFNGETYTNTKTEVLTYTGWNTDENGKTYIVDGEIAYHNEWQTIDSAAYWFNNDGYVLEEGIYWLPYPEGYGPDQWNVANSHDPYTDAGYINNSFFSIDEDGKLENSAKGFRTLAEGTVVHGKNGDETLTEDFEVWLIYGEIPWHPGLVTDGTDYYYFPTGYFEAKRAKISDTNYYISKPNELDWPDVWGDGVFGRGLYTFDAEGKIQLLNGLVDKEDKTYYYDHGVLTYAGVIKIGEYYYYVKSDYTIVKEATYYVSKTNELVNAGYYDFDAEGHMILPYNEPFFTGIYEADADNWYYYENGVKVYAGLIEIDGHLYYVNSKFNVIHNTDYPICKTNNIKPQGTYEFDENGWLVEKNEELNGIVKQDDGKWYYYVDGIKTYAGVFKIGDDYYYAKSDGEVIHGGSYYISKTNGMLEKGQYDFDEEGRMFLYDGIFKNDNGVWIYYVHGVKTYAGVIVLDGYYYYVKSDFQVVHGRKYAVSKTNGLVAAGSYNFDSEGHMILN